MRLIPNKLLKKFIIIKILGTLILGLFLTTQIKANEIRDFQIEGMSLYDSLLNYYNEEKINSSDLGWWKGKEYKTVAIMDEKNFKDFEGLQISFKRNDSTYAIENIDAIKYLNIENCYEEFDQTEKVLDELFSNAKKSKKYTYKHTADKTGESKITDIVWTFPSGNLAIIACYDWSNAFLAEKKGWGDHFRVTLSSKEFDEFAIENQ
tara:strand:+ start:343 stop:963 length:621 start_codon:yes stop_codon:yes gene_type:complete